MPLSKIEINELLCANSRNGIWCHFLNARNIKTIAEIGVFKGDFAEQILKSVNQINTYYMIDPWKNLADWNKPANKTQELFDQFFNETMEKTEFAKEKRVVLKGRTSEVIQHVPDDSLDFGYIDGDHTLRGITIDLMSLYKKVKYGGWIAGDDFTPTIWQHPSNYEPTLVFPYAVYFAEAVKSIIYALPFNQFLFKKVKNGSFEFVDLTGCYDASQLRDQLLSSYKSEKLTET